MKQRLYKLFWGPGIGVPDVHCWINQTYRVLLSCSSCATFSNFCFSISLVSKDDGKLHDHFPCFNGYQRSAAYWGHIQLTNWLYYNIIIIDCLSFIEKTDRLRFKDMMIVMARYQGQNKKGTPFVMNLKSYVPCHLILQTYVIFQLELWIKVTFGHHCTIEISATLRHYS